MENTIQHGKSKKAKPAKKTMKKGGDYKEVPMKPMKGKVAAPGC